MLIALSTRHRKRRTTKTACLHSSFAGLVVIAGSLYPIPFRTRPLNSPAPMVLSLKAWKSRSLPGLPRTDQKPHHDDRYEMAALTGGHLRFCDRCLCGRASCVRISPTLHIPGATHRRCNASPTNPSLTQRVVSARYQREYQRRYSGSRFKISASGFSVHARVT